MSMMKFEPVRGEEAEIQFVDFQVFFDRTPLEERLALIGARTDEASTIEG